MIEMRMNTVDNRTSGIAVVVVAFIAASMYWAWTSRESNCCSNLAINIDICVV